MKKVFAIMLVAGMFAVISCGPSKEEKAKAEQATKDSIAAIATADSLAKIEATAKATQDSLAAIETAKADSIKAAADAKGAKKGAKAPVAKKTTTEKAVQTQKSLKKGN